MAATPTRSRLSQADRMEQTLAAAHALFAERGYAAVTMDEVAAEVGVTKPLLYNYFGNKERLYLACMERAGDALLATDRRGRRATPTARRGAARGLRAFFAFVDADRDAWARAVRRDAAARRRDRRPGRRVPRAAASSSSPDRCSRACPSSAARRAPDRGRGALRRPARRRRGAGALVAAHRGDAPPPRRPSC